jgi:hypothetical protein
MSSKSSNRPETPRAAPLTSRRSRETALEEHARRFDELWGIRVVAPGPSTVLKAGRAGSEYEIGEWDR